MFRSGAGFVSEAVVKGLQCSSPQGASHTLKPRFVLVAPLISGNCLYPASLSLCFVCSLRFCFLFSCCCHYFWFTDLLPSLSIQNNHQTLFKLLLTNIYFIIMSVFLLFPFPPAVSSVPRMQSTTHLCPPTMPLQ